MAASETEKEDVRAARGGMVAVDWGMPGAKGEYTGAQW